MPAAMHNHQASEVCYADRCPAHGAPPTALHTFEAPTDRWGQPHEPNHNHTNVLGCGPLCPAWVEPDPPDGEQSPDNPWGAPPKAEHVVDMREGTVDGRPLTKEDLDLFPNRCTKDWSHTPHWHPFGIDTYGGYTCDGEGGLLLAAAPPFGDEFGPFLDEQMEDPDFRREWARLSAKDRRRAAWARRVDRTAGAFLARPLPSRAIGWFCGTLLRANAANVLDEIADALDAQRKAYARMERTAKRDGGKGMEAHVGAINYGLTTAIEHLRQIEASLRGPKR
jgi:hypothetical protein